MESDEASTNKNKFKSNKLASVPFSGARINKAERYCAKMITGMLYPLTTENKLMIFINKSLCFLLNILEIGFEIVVDKKRLYLTSNLRLCFGKNAQNL